MSYPEIERFEHAGCTVRIMQEEDPSFGDPRDADNLGTMVCWHPDYVLGDEQIGGSRGAVKTAFETERGRTDFESMEQIERYLRVARGAVVVLPLYLLDHSGISMSAGSNTVGRGDTAIPGGGSDSWGNSRGWDTTMCGFIYTTKDRIRELCGEPQIESDPFYCPRTWPEDGRSGENWEGTAEAWIVKQLRDEIRYYDAYIQGSVLWYCVEDAAGEIIDSCGGFLCADEEDLEYMRGEARDAAESHASEVKRINDRYAFGNVG